MHSNLKKLFVMMAACLTGLGCGAQSPKGALTYCSYSATGAAGLGKEYCELIADQDSIPKVVVVMNEGNRFGTQVIHKEYPVTQEVVESLRSLLINNKVHKLDGYNVEERMSGGHTYRIYMEYSSGRKVNAHWYGHDIKPEALSAYGMIKSFFNPWRERAYRASEPISQCSIVVRNMNTRATDHYLLLCQQGFTPRVVFDLNVDGRDSSSPEIHEQFNLEDEADIERVEQLKQALIDLNAIELGDFKQDDYIEGGNTYSVSLEYQNGRKQTLSWHTNRAVEPAAQAIYSTVMAFFSPLRKRF